MTGRLALLTLVGALCACDAPPPSKPPAQAPAPVTPVVTLSAQQIQERSAQCERKSREKFQRDFGGATAAEFAQHYSTRLDTCFYLLTVAHQETISRKLLDINENEIYGEYLGMAAGVPTTCRVESMYCASGREWEVLAAPYMQN